jgi:hypothetical protein
MSDEIKHQSFSTGTQPFARTITEIRLRDDAQLSDFRVPLPGTKEAMTCGLHLPASACMANGSLGVGLPAALCPRAAACSDSLTMMIAPNLSQASG